MLYLSPILVIVAIYVTHLVRGLRRRKRIEKWAGNREPLDDEAFYIALSLPAIRRDSAMSVRAMVSDAVRIPKELIMPSDSICELEKIGDPSHPSTADYFEDMWSVAIPKDGFALVTVRDFVIEFASRGKER